MKVAPTSGDFGSQTRTGQSRAPNCCNLSRGRRLGRVGSPTPEPSSVPRLESRLGWLQQAIRNGGQKSCGRQAPRPPSLRSTWRRSGRGRTSLPVFADQVLVPEFEIRRPGAPDQGQNHCEPVRGRAPLGSPRRPREDRDLLHLGSLSRLGNTPCLRHGRSTVFDLPSASPRWIALRVSRGSMTSSTPAQRAAM